jgi:hypothetical protein
MQSFYHGLTHTAHEQLDATGGGSFMSLTLEKYKTLMEKIASNQGWPSCNIQICNKVKKYQKSVCAVNQDGHVVELARTTRQLQERSSGHSRCIQCSKHMWRIFRG